MRYTRVTTTDLIDIIVDHKVEATGFSLADTAIVDTYITFLPAGVARLAGCDFGDFSHQHTDCANPPALAGGS